jgi:predicted nucleic acid-binding protein
MRVVPERLLFNQAVDLACELNHLAYDCFYLALAELLGTAVVTADERFANKITDRTRVVFVADFMKA